MTNFIGCLILFLCVVNSVCAGVTVLGTRFFINDNTKSLNIKLMNDNESDYLIKTNIDGGDFIISPPLFVLQKNMSNIVSIIPQIYSYSNKDKVYSLTITTIPKSARDFDKNKVSLAVRSHFNLIYYHGSPNKNDYDLINLSQSSSGEWQLVNPTDRVFLVSLTTEPDSVSKRVRLLEPGVTLVLKDLCRRDKCTLWANFLGSENNLIVQKKLTAK